MAFMTKLDVVNDMLATLGEVPLNDIDEDNPMTAAALRRLKLVELREQSREWWFNKEQLKLSPDPLTKRITVPADAITVDPWEYPHRYVQRGRFIYDSHLGTYEIEHELYCYLVRQIPFEDLPPLAQAYISVCAQIDFQKDYDADRTKAELLMDEKQKAYNLLNAEHIRNVDANLLGSAKVAYTLNKMGGVPTYTGIPNTWVVR